MFDIHPTAIVENSAQIGKNVTIGPYSYVGAQVVLRDGVTLGAHVWVGGDTIVGENTEISPFAAIGGKNQDLKDTKKKGKLIIGKNNSIREYATMQPGSPDGGNVTQVGDNNLFMIGTHVAHDCFVGNYVIMSNNATLAGHITVGDYAIIGGFSAVHQFSRIGAHAMVGGMSGVARDVIPYALLEQGRMMGINLVGMKRSGFSLEEIKATDAAVKEIFDKDAKTTLSERVARTIEKYKGCKPVEEIGAFMKVQSKRGFVQPKENADMKA